MENNLVLLEDYKRSIISIAHNLHQQDDDDKCMMYEMDAYNEILAYLLNRNISLGDYDLDDLYNDYENKYVDNWFDIMLEINKNVTSKNPPFEVHTDALELFNCFNTEFGVNHHSNS